MLRKRIWGRATRRRGRRFTRFTFGLESLEARALLAAAPVGGGFTVSGGDLGRPSGAAPAVAMLADGGALVAFAGQATSESDFFGGSFTRNTGVYLQRLGPDGELQGDPRMVNTRMAGLQTQPVMASDSAGNAWVVWHGRGAGDQVGIFGQRLAADGTPLGANVRLNSTAGGEQTQPAVAMAGDGRAVVVWQGAGSGDASGIWLRRLAADGTPIGEQVLVNTTTAGIQALPSVGIDAAGNFTVAWSSRGQDGSDWGIVGQRFSADGSRLGSEFVVNTRTEGSQHGARLAMAASGSFTIAWSSFGQDGGGWGVYAQRFEAGGGRAGGEFQLHERTAGHQRGVDAVMADSGELFFSWMESQPDGSGWNVAARAFDANGQPDGAAAWVDPTGDQPRPGHQTLPSVRLTSSGNALIAFQGSAAASRSVIEAQRFTLQITPAENQPPQLNSVANQETQAGQLVQVNVTASDPNPDDTLTFSLDTATSPSGATLEQTNNNTAVVRWTPTAQDRNQTRFIRVFVDDQDGLTDSVQFSVVVLNATPIVDLNGPAAAGNDASVLLGEGQSSVLLLDDKLVVSDEDQDELVSARITLRNILDGPAERLGVDTTGSSVVADYSPTTGVLKLTGGATPSQYRDLLRTLRYENTLSNPHPAARLVDVIVNDGSSDSDTATVTVNIESENLAPTLSALPAVTVLSGSPLWIPLNAVDANGDTLVFQATSGNASLLSTQVAAGNRSLRIGVEDFGEMVFELFEQLAPRATERIITLANSQFYDGIIFHRVIDGFMIQGGDPTGTGSGGSALGDFDDQFDVNLQHNRSGLLSMAKSSDDTNDSQFFITEAPTRHLDFNHTIFGLLVEGDGVREAISNVATDGSDRPLQDVVMGSVEVFVDPQNGALLLSAPEGASGTTQVTVTVTDGKGGTASQTFAVTVTPDTVDGSPFLDDIPRLQTLVDTTLTYQLTAQDAEDDPVVFLDQAAIDALNAQLPAPQQISLPVRKPASLDYSVNPQTGLLTMTPRDGITGLVRFTVAVAASDQGLTQFSPIDFQVVELQIN